VDRKREPDARIGTIRGTRSQDHAMDVDITPLDSVGAASTKARGASCRKALTCRSATALGHRFELTCELSHEPLKLARRPPRIE
jgi:hypothetical protein